MVGDACQTRHLDPGSRPFIIAFRQLLRGVKVVVEPIYRRKLVGGGTLMSESGGFLESPGPSTAGLWSGRGDGIWAREPESPRRGQNGLSDETNSLLRQSFGPGVDDIAVAKNEGAKNRSIAAKAHTIGNKISLGDDVRDDPRDAHSMEVIGHEVAHALAKGGSGKHVLDRKGDPGEHAAYDAGRQFRGFVEAGGKAAAPSLKPALGGLAHVHRWEAGEHVDAVANAAALAKEDGKQVSDNVTHMMSDKIKLGNGLEVTPGEITAMMGDFYSSFSKGKDWKEHLDPSKSWDQLNNADPKEMQKILDAVRKEATDVKEVREGKKDKFEATDSGVFESITKNRRNEDGQHSFLELAQRNKSHFTTQDESGTDNNMGAYSAFHKMALEAAQRGDKEKARALESCAQHYLTDRFSGGHQFDKQKIMDAAGSPNAEDIKGNVVARIIHNDYDEHGVTVHDKDWKPGQEDGRGKPTADQHEWKAKGDEHWADADNKVNRKKSAQATVDSFAEIDAVLNGEKTIKQVEKDGFKARDTIPQYDAGRQESTESWARNMSYWDIAKKEIGEAPGAIKGKILRTLGKVENGLSDAWDFTKDKAGKAWDFTKKTAGGVWDFAKEKASDGWSFVKDKAGKAWEGAKETASDAWKATKEGAGRAWEGTKEAASETWGGIKRGASEAWEGAKDAGSQVWEGTKEAGKATWGAMKSGAKAIGDTAGQAWDGAKDIAGKGWKALKGLF